MPQDNPELSQLSEPVEPNFQDLLYRTCKESYDYGLNKYGIPLHSFNGRSELQDFAEEWVSAGRYVVQLAMRTHKLEELLIRAMGVFEGHFLDKSPALGPLMAEIREAVRQACGERK